MARVVSFHETVSFAALFGVFCGRFICEAFFASGFFPQRKNRCRRSEKTDALLSLERKRRDDFEQRGRETRLFPPRDRRDRRRPLALFHERL